MKLFKYLAMAALIAFASPVLSAPTPTHVATAEGEFNIESQYRQFGEYSFFDIGTYKLLASLTSHYGEYGFTGVTFTIQNTAKEIFATINAGTSGDVPAFSGYKDFSIAVAGNYRIVMTGGGMGGWTEANASVDKVAAVPGPEAGAGLTGLAMAGLGAYVVRRRKQIAA